MLAAAISTIGFGVQSVEAKTLTFTTKKPSSCSFTGSAWERTRDIIYNETDIVLGELCYGYDTVLTNEDYVWTRSVQYSHKSYLKNSDGTYTSAEFNASASSTWAKVEKKNDKGSDPTYGIQFLNVVSDTSASDFTIGDAVVTHHKE